MLIILFLGLAMCPLTAPTIIIEQASDQKEYESEQDLDNPLALRETIDQYENLLDKMTTQSRLLADKLKQAEEKSAILSQDVTQDQLDKLVNGGLVRLTDIDEVSIKMALHEFGELITEFKEKIGAVEGINSKGDLAGAGTLAPPPIHDIESGIREELEAALRRIRKIEETAIARPAELPLNEAFVRIEKILGGVKDLLHLQDHGPVSIDPITDQPSLREFANAIRKKYYSLERAEHQLGDARTALYDLQDQCVKTKQGPVLQRFTIENLELNWAMYQDQYVEAFQEAKKQKAEMDAMLRHLPFLLGPGIKRMVEFRSLLGRQCAELGSLGLPAVFEQLEAARDRYRKLDVQIREEAGRGPDTPEDVDDMIRLGLQRAQALVQAFPVSLCSQIKGDLSQMISDGKIGLGPEIFVELKNEATATHEKIREALLKAPEKATVSDKHEPEIAQKFVGSTNNNEPDPTNLSEPESDIKDSVPVQGQLVIEPNSQEAENGIPVRGNSDLEGPTSNLSTENSHAQENAPPKLDAGNPAKRKEEMRKSTSETGILEPPVKKAPITEPKNPDASKISEPKRPEPTVSGSGEGSVGKKASFNPTKAHLGTTPKYNPATLKLGGTKEPTDKKADPNPTKASAGTTPKYNLATFKVGGTNGPTDKKASLNPTKARAGTTSTIGSITHQKPTPSATGEKKLKSKRASGNYIDETWGMDLESVLATIGGKKLTGNEHAPTTTSMAGETSTGSQAKGEIPTFPKVIKSTVKNGTGPDRNREGKSTSKEVPVIPSGIFQKSYLHSQILSTKTEGKSDAPSQQRKQGK